MQEIFSSILQLHQNKQKVNGLSLVQVIQCIFTTTNITVMEKEKK